MARRGMVAVYVKRQLRLDRLSFDQRQMFKLGVTGLANVTQRVQSGLGPEDSAAKPLNKRYAKYKSRVLRKAAVRDLTFTGNMLRNLSVRNVSENRASASLTSRKDRAKGKIMSGIQPWLVFSTNNALKTVENAKRIFAEGISRLPILKFLSSDQ